MEPDPWQMRLLTSSHDQILVLCSRQSGKSQCAAGLAILEALLNPGAEILIISRALRQSAELLRKVKELYRGLRGEVSSKRRRAIQRFRPPEQSSREAPGTHDMTVGPHKFRAAGHVLKDHARIGSEEGFEFNLAKPLQDSVLSMELENGSRIISLPGTPDTIVGYSAIDLLIMDEASRIPDDLYRSVRPMLAVSRNKGSGKLVALSTPFGKRGWFYEEHKRCMEAANRGEPPPWDVITITADQCPRIDSKFLEEERQSIGERWFMQEYFVNFVDTIDSVFSAADIAASVVRAGDRRPGEELLEL